MTAKEMRNYSVCNLEELDSIRLKLRDIIEAATEALETAENDYLALTLAKADQDSGANEDEEDYGDLGPDYRIKIDNLTKARRLDDKLLWVHADMVSLNKKIKEGEFERKPVAE